LTELLGGCAVKVECVFGGVHIVFSFR
jgi:hypothetical protein